jgi:hypothetical protein
VKSISCRISHFCKFQTLDQTLSSSRYRNVEFVQVLTPAYVFSRGATVLFVFCTNEISIVGCLHELILRFQNFIESTRGACYGALIVAIHCHALQ